LTLTNNFIDKSIQISEFAMLIGVSFSFIPTPLSKSLPKSLGTSCIGLSLVIAICHDFQAPMSLKKLANSF